jgi:hypothetical protein
VTAANSVSHTGSAAFTLPDSRSSRFRPLRLRRGRSHANGRQPCVVARGWLTIGPCDLAGATRQ